MPALAVDYDVVISNGRVIDPETNFDGVRNNELATGHYSHLRRFGDGIDCPCGTLTPSLPDAK